MALRSNWKGYFKLSLVSIPVKAYSAVNAGEGEVHFHQLHKKCNSRIKYQKTCPIHGAVPNSEIVSGYEYSKGQYVVIDAEEIDRMRSESDKAITIVAVVPTTSIDPVYFTERSSYLLPDGPVGQKAFALVQRALAEQDRIAVGHLVRGGRDEVVVVRPMDDLLSMTVINGPAEVKLPSAFSEELPVTDVSAAELKLTKTLLESFHQDEVDLAQYRDQFTERVSQLIQARVAGKEVVTPEPAAEPNVINLMDAIRKSVEQAKSKPAKPATKSASKRHAIPSARANHPVKHKRKTG